MKVNFNQAFKSFDGTEVTEPYEVKEGVTKHRPKMISTMVASFLFLGEGLTSVEEKMMSANLSQRIYSATEPVEISVEEASLIKQLAGKTLIAGAYAQVVNLLEDNSKK